ncbi:hypothetical protein LC55x_3630 [Lysobacter capsici]|nr:hypothetical protein LC55x_3630 [Lysobacter capsici]
MNSGCRDGNDSIRAESRLAIDQAAAGYFVGTSFSFPTLSTRSPRTWERPRSRRYDEYRGDTDRRGSAPHEMIARPLRYHADADRACLSLAARAD